MKTMGVKWGFASTLILKRSTFSQAVREEKEKRENRKDEPLNI